MPENAVAITSELVAEHGLTAEEYDRLLNIMGREPTLTELGIFSVMWSEHCSYKSSRKWLKTLPTEAPWVICGPGENAGVIDIGDGLACIFKIESHNHPSFIEPYQGAATGVGGIMRDVFTMGARPIANMNALRFGEPDHPKTRHLVSGVVAGIGGYGNCMGIPTVGGETNFHPAYNGNILVNAMTVGLAPADRIFYSSAAGVGNPVVYVGSKTGRDGIHGATMASAEFAEDSEEKRPTVQVGDPFTEKLLLEACLELMATDAIIAIQDMGAAGLTSSSVEMSSKGGVGIDLNLDQVPCREEAMTGYEIMLSESQERMLMVLKPEREEEARRIFDKWELDFAVIGSVTDTGHLRLVMSGETLADIPVDPLVAQAPEYDRPWTPSEKRTRLDPADIPERPFRETLFKMIGSADICSRRWIWEQYDHLINGKTVQRPGGDAAVVTIEDTDKALAITTDCTPRYCVADPYEGGKQAVAEAWRNLCAVGAKPLAATNNLNFGNPERPEIMGQLVEGVKGMGDACRSLDFPIVSGNVSLYNETSGEAILPTPVIGGVGLLAATDKMVGVGGLEPGDGLVVIGGPGTWLGSSLYLQLIENRVDGAPPPVDLDDERKHGEFIRNQIDSGLIHGCHDISDGGLLIAAVEMAMASGSGMVLDAPPPDTTSAQWYYGEDQSRYLVATKDVEALIAAATAMAISAKRIGTAEADPSLTVADHNPISLSELIDLHENWLPNFMAGTSRD